MGARNKLLMKYPASWHGDMWRDALPVGNGEIGALVYGGVYKEVVALMHGRLWWQDITMPLPDVSDVLPEIRKRLAENDAVGAEWLMVDALKERGYTPKSARPLPLCDINVIMKNHTGFKGYSRVLDMERAQAVVSWKDGSCRYERKFFISRENDIAFFSITADGGQIDAELSFSVHDTESLKAMEPPGNIASFAEAGVLKYAACDDKKVDFGAAARVYHDGTERCKGAVMHIAGATSIVVCTKLFIGCSRNTGWEECLRTLCGHSDYTYELNRHTALHAQLFNHVVFTLGDGGLDHANEELLMQAYEGAAPAELIEKLWSFGRYLLICASRENGYPCQLYGLWTGSYTGKWAFNMFNVNLQMIYWQALSGNMPQLMMSVFDYVESKMEDYRENARKLYGCRGINIPSVSTPESGLHKCLLPHIIHWTGAAGWICQHYYDYYLYTGDRTFLKERAMPFMYEAALFYEDFMQTDTHGTLVASPSNSPENTPKNLKDSLKRDCEVTINATMDFAILKELLTNIINGAAVTGMYAEKIPVWKEMLSKIPAYQFNEDKTVREWMHPFYEDNHEHRHQSHVYPIFPGTEVTQHSSPDMYRAFSRTIEKRKVVGLKDQSNWSLMYMANVFARLGNGEAALECIDDMTRSTVISNFFTVSNDWRRMGIAMCEDMRDAPIQLDANMGLCAAINEMAVFSANDEIYLFHAIPRGWKNFKIGPLGSRACCEITLERKETTATATIRHGGEEAWITLILPDDMRFRESGQSVMRVCLEKNETKTFEMDCEKG